MMIQVSIGLASVASGDVTRRARAGAGSTIPVLPLGPGVTVTPSVTEPRSHAAGTCHTRPGGLRVTAAAAAYPMMML